MPTTAMRAKEERASEGAAGGVAGEGGESGTGQLVRVVVMDRDAKRNHARAAKFSLHQFWLAHRRWRTGCGAKLIDPNDDEEDSVRQGGSVPGIGLGVGQGGVVPGDGKVLSKTTAAAAASHGAVQDNTSVGYGGVHVAKNTCK